jgi:hypothetical protein
MAAPGAVCIEEGFFLQMRKTVKQSVPAVSLKESNKNKAAGHLLSHFHLPRLST